MLFGPETFESAELPGLFDSVATAYGDATVALDSSFELSQQYSIRFAATGEGAAYAQKILDAGESTLHLQTLIKFSSDYVLPSGGYFTLLWTQDNANSEDIYLVVEDYGALRLTMNGTSIGYIDTGINISKDEEHKIELQIIKSDTTGRIRIWLDNDVEGSPDYDSGDIDTVAGATDLFQFGVQYTPGSMTGEFWLDNIYADIEFIGNQVPPFRFENLPGIVFDENDTKTIYAERLNDILERIEALEQA